MTPVVVPHVSSQNPPAVQKRDAKQHSTEGCAQHRLTAPSCPDDVSQWSLKWRGPGEHGLSWCWWNQCLLYDPSMTGSWLALDFYSDCEGSPYSTWHNFKKNDPRFHTSVLAHVPLIRSEWLPPSPFQGAVVHWWGDANHKFHDVTLNALGRSLRVWFTWWCFTFPIRSLPVAEWIGENEKNMEESNFLGGS